MTTVAVRYLTGQEVQLSNCVNVGDVKVRVALQHGRLAPDVVVLDDSSTVLRDPVDVSLVPHVTVVLLGESAYDEDAILDALVAHAASPDPAGIEPVLAQISAREALLGKALLDYVKYPKYGAEQRVIGRLLAAGARMDCTDRGGNNALMHACLHNSQGSVQLLLDAKCPIDTNNVGESTLQVAAKYGHGNVVQMLLNSGAFVDERNPHGSTALHSAAMCDHASVVTVLLRANACVNGKDRHGDTPLLWAASYGCTKSLTALLDAKADLHDRDGCGDTPLHRAASYGFAEVVRLLLAANADANRRGEHETTALHWAASAGYDDIVKLLITAGADVHARTDVGSTPSELAMQSGQTHVVQLIEKLAKQANECSTQNLHM